MEQDKNPQVIIHSDASVSKHGIGTFACYIKTPAEEYKKSGILKAENLTDSFWAERFGIANALFLADTYIDLSKFDLIVYCDNIKALEKDALKNTPASAVWHIRKKRRDWFEENIEIYLNKAKSFELRHIKSHVARRSWDTQGRDPEMHRMNDWCDKEAKRLRLEAIRRNLKERVSEQINNT